MKPGGEVFFDAADGAASKEHQRSQPRQWLMRWPGLRVAPLGAPYIEQSWRSTAGSAGGTRQGQGAMLGVTPTPFSLTHLYCTDSP
ncbi:unnamed protein product [Gadus morhua 'NCC']